MKGLYGGDMSDDVSPSAAAPDSIAAIRAQIDALDSQVLTLVTQRLRLAEQVANAKTASTGLPIRPGREVVLLRRLISESKAPLDRELVVELWRALIAASLRRQRVIDVVVGGGRGDPTRLFDIARRHFGARTRIKDVGEPQNALQRAVESPETTVAVTWWPAAPQVGAWWPALSERRFHALNIIAGLPLLQGTDEPEAALFAVSPPEEAGGDITMLLAFDRHHRLKRGLEDAGFAGAEVARAEPRVLVKVQGYIAADDPRIAVLARTISDDVRVLGSYARI